MSRKTLLQNISGSAGGGGALLLDAVNAKAAFSVFKVRTAYTGSCLKVRRSSDDTTLDIGFNGTELNTSDLISFVGGGDGFVEVWYDQTDNGMDVSQLTLASQPKIVIGGVVETLNGKPSMVIDGNQYMVGPVSSRTFLKFAHTTQATLTAVSTSSPNASGIWITTSSAAFGNPGNIGFEFGYGVQGNDLAVRGDGGFVISHNLVTNFGVIPNKLIYADWDNTAAVANRSKIFVNSVLDAASNTGTNTPIDADSFNSLTLFGKFFGTANPIGHFSEFILWEGRQDAIRGFIESDTNSRFGIY